MKIIKLSRKVPFFIAIMFLLFILAVAIFLKKGIAEKMLRPVFSFFVPEKYKDKLKASFKDFYDGITVLKNNKLATIMGCCGSSQAICLLGKSEKDAISALVKEHYNKRHHFPPRCLVLQ